MSDPDKNGASSRDRTIALLGALALVLLIVVGIGYAALGGRDLASFAPTLLGFATPTIVALLGILGFHIGIGVLMGLPWFSLTMIAVDAIFIRDATWKGMQGHVSRAWANSRAAPGRAPDADPDRVLTRSGATEQSG